MTSTADWQCSFWMTKLQSIQSDLESTRSQRTQCHRQVQQLQRALDQRIEDRKAMEQQTQQAKTEQSSLLQQLDQQQLLLVQAELELQQAIQHRDFVLVQKQSLKDQLDMQLQLQVHHHAQDSRDATSGCNAGSHDAAAVVASTGISLSTSSDPILQRAPLMAYMATTSVLLVLQEQDEPAPAPAPAPAHQLAPLLALFSSTSHRGTSSTSSSMNQEDVDGYCNLGAGGALPAQDLSTTTTTATTTATTPSIASLQQQLTLLQTQQTQHKQRRDAVLADYQQQKAKNVRQQTRKEQLQSQLDRIQKDIQRIQRQQHRQQRALVAPAIRVGTGTGNDTAMEEERGGMDHQPSGGDTHATSGSSHGASVVAAAQKQRKQQQERKRRKFLSTTSQSSSTCDGTNNTPASRSATTTGNPRGNTTTVTPSTTRVNPYATSRVTPTPRQKTMTASAVRGGVMPNVHNHAIPTNGNGNHNIVAATAASRPHRVMARRSRSSRYFGASLSLHNVPSPTPTPASTGSNTHSSEDDDDSCLGSSKSCQERSEMHTSSHSDPSPHSPIATQKRGRVQQIQQTDVAAFESDESDPEDNERLRFKFRV